MRAPIGAEQSTVAADPVAKGAHRALALPG